MTGEGEIPNLSPIPGLLLLMQTAKMEYLSGLSRANGMAERGDLISPTRSQSD